MSFLPRPVVNTQRWAQGCVSPLRVYRRSRIFTIGEIGGYKRLKGVPTAHTSHTGTMFAANLLHAILAGRTTQTTLARNVDVDANLR